MCGAGRVVCLIDPIGDVYACPFVIHDEFRAGSVRDPRRVRRRVARVRAVPRAARAGSRPGACASCGSYDACQGGCMAAKFFTGLPLDGPDPECVKGHGEALLAGVGAGDAPRPAMDHSPPAAARLVRPPLTRVFRRIRVLCGIRALGSTSDETRGSTACACSNRSARATHGAEPDPVRAPRDQPGRRRPPLHGRHTAYYERRARGGCGTIVVEGASVHESDWPYERAPLASRCRSRVGGDRGRLPAARHAGPRVARSRRRPGLVGVQPGAAVGAVAGARGGVARGAEVDGGRRHRRRRRRIRRRRVSGGRRRVRWRRDQRRPAQPRAPVPLRADEPPRRRLGRRPPALRPRGDRRRAQRLWGRTASSACGCRATSWRRGRGSPRTWRRRSPSTLVGAGVDYVVVVRGSIFSIEQTRPDFHQPPGFNVELAAAVAAALDVPVVLQGSVVDVGQAEWAVGGYDDPARCAGVEMTRAQIADPISSPSCAPVTPTASARAPAATRRARSATPATRS